MAEWSDLPIDVLEHLTRFLPLPDYHRFSAVCRNWAIAAAPRRYSLAKQLPWLLVRGETDPQKRRVFSISENRHYNIDFSELQGTYVCGSSYGWLFTLDMDLNSRLLNPLTGGHHDLPRLPHISNGDTRDTRSVREAIYDAYGAGYVFHMTYEDAQTKLVYKVITNHDPSQRSDFTVLILYGTVIRSIAFWRPGDAIWTQVEGNYFSFDDIALFKGNFYASVAWIGTSRTYLVDVGLNPKVTEIAVEVPLYDDSRTYLIDFRGELLLLQMCRTKVKEDHLLTRGFLVYKLDLEEGKYHQRHHLDGYSIFLGNSSPSIVHRDEFPGCNENCIYFTAHVDCDDEEYGRDDNGIYDMVKDTVSPYYSPEIYHPKNVGPIWWTPNPW